MSAHPSGRLVGAFFQNNKVALSELGSQQNLIAIKGVTHAYRKDGDALPVLEDLTLGIPRHGFTAVVGPVWLWEVDIDETHRGSYETRRGRGLVTWRESGALRGRQLRMAFQNPVLLEWRSILKNVLLPLEIVPTTLSKKEAEDRARHLLHLVGLSGFEDKRPSELSGSNATACVAV